MICRADGQNAGRANSALRQADNWKSVSHISIRRIVEFLKRTRLPLHLRVIIREPVQLSEENV